jgi:hypothetical protein
VDVQFSVVPSSATLLFQRRPKTSERIENGACSINSDWLSATRTIRSVDAAYIHI